MLYQILRSESFVIYFSLFSFLSGNEENLEHARPPNMLKDLGLNNDESVRRGEQKLRDFQSQSSPCWMKAVKELQFKCSEMTDIEQSILAMKFANCHFEKSGLKTYDCTDKSDFQMCTKTMKTEDETSFIVYTTFFTHVTDICFYLQSEIWRQKTAETITKLSMTTEDTIEKLDQSLQNQYLVLESQNKSLINQRLILENEETLKTTLEDSTNNAKAAFDHMKEKADEQQAIFSRTFDGIFDGVHKLTELQTMLLGEFISLQSFAFYIVSLVSCYLVTSSPRTIDARLYLFTFFALLVFIEKIIVDKALRFKELHGSATEWLHHQVWFARKVFIAVSLFILGYFAIKYRDINRINNEMLKEIQQRILEIYEIEVKKKQKMEALDEVDSKDQDDQNGFEPQVVHSKYSMLEVDIPKASTPLRQPVSVQQIPRKEPGSIVSDGFEGDVDWMSNESGAGDSPEKRILFSDDDDDKDATRKTNKFSKKNFVKQSKKRKRNTEKGSAARAQDENAKLQNESVNSRYNLRARSITPVNSPNISLFSMQTSPKRSQKKTEKRDTKKNKKLDKSGGLFSSDDDF